MIYSTVNHQEFPFFDPTHPPPWWRNTWMPPKWSKTANQSYNFVLMAKWWKVPANDECMSWVRFPVSIFVKNIHSQSTKTTVTDINIFCNLTLIILNRWMAWPPNYTVGARQSSRVSYVCYKKELITLQFPVLDSRIITQETSWHFLSRLLRKMCVSLSYSNHHYFHVGENAALSLFLSD